MSEQSSLDQIAAQAPRNAAGEITDGSQPFALTQGYEGSPTEYNYLQRRIDAAEAGTPMEGGEQSVEGLKAQQQEALEAARKHAQEHLPSYVAYALELQANSGQDDTSGQKRK